jgi:predicted phosphodiesterase
MKWRFLAFSCLHTPLHDEDAVDWMLGQIREFRPNVIVHLGDGHEADAASRWPTEEGFTLQDEFDTHNEILYRVRQNAYARTRLVFLPGNHEANILGKGRIARKIRGLVDYRDYEEELEYWEQPAEYVYRREGGTFSLGQVTFTHGYETAKNGENQTYALGLPWGLVIAGHTHRPSPVTQLYRLQNMPVPYWYANAGCLRNIDKVDWMQSKRRSAWGHAVVVGEADDWRYMKGYIPTEKLWWAETRIRRMFDV